ncbi:MAG: hypothetical protein C0412_17760 [Flavobacterium sp.]|nr:hypothetical protein [Flavobacterium sp.]
MYISGLWYALTKVPKLPRSIRSTNDLSDRIYRNFEFFIKIFLALAGGYGLIKFKYAKHIFAAQAQIGIGLIGLITMASLVLSVASLQGWKIPRWDEVNWKLIWTWQEIYMMLAMYALSCMLWVAAIIL